MLPTPAGQLRTTAVPGTPAEAVVMAEDEGASSRSISQRTMHHISDWSVIGYSLGLMSRQDCAAKESTLSRAPDSGVDPVGRGRTAEGACATIHPRNKMPIQEEAGVAYVQYGTYLRMAFCAQTSLLRAVPRGERAKRSAMDDLVLRTATPKHLCRSGSFFYVTQSLVACCTALGHRSHDRSRAGGRRTRSEGSVPGFPPSRRRSPVENLAGAGSVG